jgi:hypothetical protein
MNRATTKRPVRTVRGLDWINERRGKYVAHLDGRWELELRTWSPEDGSDTGWHLYGPEGQPFGLFMDRLLVDALEGATSYVFSYGETSAPWQT